MAVLVVKLAWDGAGVTVGQWPVLTVAYHFNGTPAGRNYCVRGKRVAYLSRD